MSVVICFCSDVGCLKHVVCYLDLILIVAPLSVTLKIAVYSMLFHMPGLGIVCYLKVDTTSKF